MTDSTPFRLQVLTAVTDALKEIHPGNGYNSDLRDIDDAGDGGSQERVFRGRSWFGENDPDTMISLLEGVNPADEPVEVPDDMAAGEFEWPILIQGFVLNGASHPTDPAYFLSRDVARRLSKEKLRKTADDWPDPLGLRGLAPKGCAVLKLRVGSPVVRPADDISARAYFWLVLTLTIVEDPMTA